METTILNIKNNKKIINKKNCNIMKNNNLIFNKFCSNSIFSKDLEIYSSSPNLSNEQFWPPPSNNNKNKKELIKYLMFKL